jgi:hypothetical protein
VAACALAELGRCSAPCEHRISVEDYAVEAAQPFREATTADLSPLVRRLMARIEAFSSAQRFEEAAAVRERLVVLLRATIRMQRLRSLTDLAEVIVARPADGGGWELAIVRYGRLVAAGRSSRHVHPRGTIETLLATGHAADTGRDGRGDRARSGVDGEAGRAARRGLGRVGAAGSRRRAVHRSARESRGRRTRHVVDRRLPVMAVRHSLYQIKSAYLPDSRSVSAGQIRPTTRLCRNGDRSFDTKGPIV